MPAVDPSTFELWLRLAGIGVAVVLAALIAHRVLRRVLRRIGRYSKVLGAVIERCNRPAAFGLPLMALSLYWQGVPDTVPGIAGVEHLTGVLTIIAVTWFAAAAIQGAATGVIALHDAEVADNLEARRVQTQTRVLARIAGGLVMFAGLAFVLMTFPRARQLGASLLASAGVAGLVIGLAARAAVGNLLAGLQIALAQPIRIDDVLIVEGEWGRVEEITATYVVLKIWDERRLIVPLQWFIEHPFQNWTRSSSQILGTVMLWVDFTLPVETVRQEAQRLCETSPLWDRRVCLVQVTEASDRAMQLRILVSSASSGQNFDLRCLVREGLIEHLRRHHADALPRLRTESDAGPNKMQPPAPAAPGSTP